MKPSELRDLSERELREHVQTARRDLLGLRFQNATGELENTSSLRGAKQEIARALTIAAERGIEIRS
jgi:large subunit ribosomal protein L29